MKATSRQQTPSLKEVYRNHFLIGAALDFRRPDEFTSAELEFIKTHFNALTPENSMKPGPVHPQENTWNWTQPDALVKFCGENNMQAIGHNLSYYVNFAVAERIPGPQPEGFQRQRAGGAADSAQDATANAHQSGTRF